VLDPKSGKIDCKCLKLLVWNEGRTACVDKRRELAEERCNQLVAALDVAAQAGDINQFRGLLAQAQDCPFYQQALGILQNMQAAALLQQHCQQIAAALDAAYQAGDLNRFRAILPQARDCPFYQQALAMLQNANVPSRAQPSTSS